MKRLFTLVLTLWIVGGGVAQESFGQNGKQSGGFEVGIRDGISFSHLVGIDNTSPHVGLYAGVTASYFFDSGFGIGIDVTLSEQGAYCNPNADGVAVDFRYDYLNVPLLMQYNIPLGGSSLRVLAGAQVGVFLLGSYEYTAPSILGDGMVSGSDWLDRDDFHPYDIGVTVGAQWMLWDDFLLIEARYTLGITQTHDGVSNTLGGNYFISVPDNRNSVIQIGTALLF